MGLFSRTNAETNGEDNLEEIDLPNSKDLKGEMFNSEQTNSPSIAQPRVAAQLPTPKARGVYSIEDAINLMKSLPKENNEVVVTVVKKTLESIQIRVPDIVADANQKETRIRNQHKTLEGEIKDLQGQIAQRNQQISDLLKDLKETTDVRERLQLAMELDGDAKSKDKVDETAIKTNATPKANQAGNTPKNTSNSVNEPASKGSVDSNNQNIQRRPQQRSNPSH